MTKRFGSVTAVDGVSLDIAAGEFVTLLGASGCGKTTLLRIIAGFTAPDAGELWIDDRRVEGLPPRLRNIGFVFQSYALFPTMTVAGNIGFGLRLRRRPKAETAARVAELCELTQLQGLEDRYPHELSGGQQQRVALARALALNPSILLLDEPLSALDAKIRSFLRAEIRSVVQRLGITTVYVTHDQEEALSISDRVVVMDRGRFLQIGSPIEVYTRPASGFVADFIGTSNRLPGRRLPDGRVAVVDTALDVVLPEALRGRDRCLVCIRPEHLVLDKAPGGEAGRPGVLEAYSFLGQTVRAVVAADAATRVLIDMPTARWLELGLRVGDAVTWRVEPGHAMVFPDDTP